MPPHSCPRPLTHHPHLSGRPAGSGAPGLGHLRDPVPPVPRSGKQDPPPWPSPAPALAPHPPLPQCSLQTWGPTKGSSPKDLASPHRHLERPGSLLLPRLGLSRSSLLGTPASDQSSLIRLSKTLQAPPRSLLRRPHLQSVGRNTHTCLQGALLQALIVMVHGNLTRMSVWCQLLSLSCTLPFFFANC